LSRPTLVSMSRVKTEGKTEEHTGNEAQAGLAFSPFDPFPPGIDSSPTVQSVVLPGRHLRLLFSFLRQLPQLTSRQRGELRLLHKNQKPHLLTSVFYLGHGVDFPLSLSRHRTR